MPPFTTEDIAVIKTHLEDGFASVAPDMRLELAIGYLRGLVEDVEGLRRLYDQAQELLHEWRTFSARRR